MLMMGTSELAERLFVAWRERMEFVQPVDPYREWGSLRTRATRPLWRDLTTVEQDVWKHVAEAAGLSDKDAVGGL